MESYNFVSFCGIFILLGLAWLLSADRKNLNWRLIVCGLGLQLLFGLFVFVIPAGAKLFLLINDVVISVIECAAAGSRFMFGRLALPPGTADQSGVESLGFFFAFQALPTIIFFSALMSILYYVGIMPWIISKFAVLFSRLMKLSGAESLCAASNIFVGIEASFAVRPYLLKMTPSEFCTVLTAGMATVASNVLAIYVFTLRDYFPNIAGHLVSASIIAAPSALIMSKMLLPESGEPVTLGVAVAPVYEKEESLFVALINGANTGLKVAAGIAALLLAVLGLVALLDLVMTMLGGRVNLLCGLQIDWSLKGLLGYLFYPLMLVIGIPAADAGTIAGIVGERVVVTEITAYQDLAAAMANDVLVHKRSAVIATYALCGFAHVASVAIFVGGISALVPQRTADLARVGMRALVAATLACLLTACIAGTFFNQTSLLMN